MRRFLLLLCCLFISVNVCLADPEWAFDTLAGAKYPKVIRTIPRQYGIGIFAETFGDAFPVVKKELYASRIFVRVHFIWSDSHSFGDNDIRNLQRLSKKYAPLCNTGRLEISPFCEHNLKNPDKYLDIVAARMPGCRIVNTPWKGSLSKKYKNEVHGSHPPPSGVYNYSFDGTNAVDANVESYKKKYGSAERFFFWWARFNLRWSTNDTRSREERLKNPALPTKHDTDSIEYLAGAKGLTSLPKKWLLKSHSERHGENDPKGDKLLFIGPVKTNEIQLKRSKKVLATLPYYGAYTDGRSRYYWKDLGFSLGSEVELWANKKKVGIVNPGFRENDYRQ